MSNIVLVLINGHPHCINFRQKITWQQKYMNGIENITLANNKVSTILKGKNKKQYTIKICL